MADNHETYDKSMHAHLKRVKDRLMLSVQDVSPMLEYAGEVALLLGIELHKAQNLLRGLLNDSNWESTGIQGVSRSEALGSSAVKDYLKGFVKIQPGHEFPHHTHNGEEVALILSGRCVELPANNMLEAGTLVFVSPDIEHSARVPEEDEEPVIYLALAEQGIQISECHIAPDNT